MTNTAFPISNEVRNNPGYGHNFSEAGHYVVTAHRPGVVLMAKKCSFMGIGTNVRVRVKCFELLDIVFSWPVMSYP